MKKVTMRRIRFQLNISFMVAKSREQCQCHYHILQMHDCFRNSWFRWTWRGSPFCDIHLWWRVAARTSFEERLSFTLSCHRLLISEFYCLTDPLPVDISILKEMDLKLLFYTLILVNYSKQDAEVITKRKFVSKARSEYIKVSKASEAKRAKRACEKTLNFRAKN